MICSPCLTCHRKHLPKDKCMETCERLRMVQETLVTIREQTISHAIDYAEEGRFTINSRALI